MPLAGMLMVPDLSEFIAAYPDIDLDMDPRLRNPWMSFPHRPVVFLTFALNYRFGRMDRTRMTTSPHPDRESLPIPH